MSDPGVLVSVRGEARRTVPPDSAVIAATIASIRESKAEAARAAAAALEIPTADLAGMGGVAFGVDTLRRPLTWSAQSAATHEEQFYVDKAGRSEPTGRVIATVALQITVRAFDLLDGLGSHLAGHETVSVHEVSWHVDWDNPGWREVRAAAIQAAISTGRDYAAALGGRLSTVQHIADPGLIGGGEGQQYRFTSAARTVGYSARGGENADAPSLDPVPQELAAFIEARFSAFGIELTQDPAHR